MESSLERAAKDLTEVIQKDREDLVQLCLLLGGTPSPHAHEMGIARVVLDWFRQNGIEAFLQPITSESANAVGVIKAEGKGGKKLVFDAHFDSEVEEGKRETVERMEKGFTDGNTLYGYSIVNDKGQLAAFMIAARAIKKAGIKLQGDLVVAGVTHETGPSSIDEFSGIEAPGDGFGTRWLIDRGVIPDFALVGETSGFGIVAVEGGKVVLKVTVKGRKVYTPRLPKVDAWQKHPNAYIKAAHVITAIGDWAAKREDEKKLESEKGTIIPKSQIIGVRGSAKAGTAGRDCYIYIEIYLLPEEDPRAVAAEMEQLLTDLGVEGHVDTVQWSRGYFARGAEPLIKAVEDAHRYVTGAATPEPQSPDISMWRDLNPFNEVGIPSICYGPPRQKETYTDAQNRAVKIDDLLAATKVYALTALKICGVA